MDASTAPATAGYWYGDTDPAGDPRRVLEALRRYRAAEMAMRRRTRRDMDMNETDLAALRYVLRSARERRQVTPSVLMTHLGITMASVTALVTRLEKSGHLRRELHPTDGRSRVIVASEHADTEVRATLDGMHRRMLDAAAGLTPAEIDTVVGFLDRMEHALDAVGASPGH